MVCKLLYTLSSQREFGPPVECVDKLELRVRARLRGGAGPQVGEVTRLGRVKNNNTNALKYTYS